MWGLMMFCLGDRSQGAQPAHLDPLLSYPSNILGRERTIILNLEVRVLPPLGSEIFI
jgi:hypothetical protein